MSRRQINFRLDEVVVRQLDEIQRRKKLRSRTSAVEHAASYYYSELVKVQQAASTLLEVMKENRPDSVFTLVEDGKVELDGKPTGASWSVQFDEVSYLDVLLVTLMEDPTVELQLASWLHEAERPGDTFAYKVSDLHPEMQRFGAPIGYNPETHEESIERLAQEWHNEDKSST